MGPLELKIRKKIEGLRPLSFEVINESHNHSVPKNSETHFKVILVSEIFEGQSRIQRQRYINEMLSEELKNGVHALTMRLLTPTEFEKEKIGSFESPACRGGSKQG